MTVGQFARLIEEMRAAQRYYLRTRSDSARRKVKELEAVVDKLLAERKERLRRGQGVLFQGVED